MPSVDLAELTEDLELACMDALAGDPPGPLLANRLRTVVTAILHSRGIRGTVAAASDRSGTRVHVTLGPPGSKARQLVINLGPR